MDSTRHETSNHADPARHAPLHGLVNLLVDSYRADPDTQHINATFLPNRGQVIEIIEALRCLTFPGFFDDARITDANLHEHTDRLLRHTDHLIYEQIRQALRYQLNRDRDGLGDRCDDCDRVAREKTDAFLRRIPEVRRLLSTDVRAAYDGDPANAHTDEAIFCYPGLDAIFNHRYAHELYQLEVPLLPRIMAEVAHNETGIDLHPGAKIGERFFIDHGTGIVVGQTCEIGRDVKLYQGVTLGALSLKGGHDRWEGRKRHPTIEDGVTIYGGAIILGGNTVIGKGATIGGSVFITASVPAGHTVTMKQPQLTLKPPRNAATPAGEGHSSFDPVV